MATRIIPPTGFAPSAQGWTRSSTCAAEARASAPVDRDLAGRTRRGGAFGHRQRQHALLEIGRDLVAIGVRRQAKRAAERAILTFGEKPRVALFLARMGLFAFDGHDAVMHGNVDLVFGHAG